MSQSTYIVSQGKLGKSILDFYLASAPWQSGNAKPLQLKKASLDNRKTTSKCSFNLNTGGKSVCFLFVKLNLIAIHQNSLFALESWTPKKSDKNLTSRFIPTPTCLSSKASKPSRQITSQLNKAYLRKTIWIQGAGIWSWHPKVDNIQLWRKS